MENKKLKAYIVTDNFFLDEYALVFTTSADKAKSLAFSCGDLFWDNKYIDLRANRAPKLDKFADDEYCYNDYWNDMEVRRVLIEEYSFQCNQLNPKECIFCKCNDICEMWEEYKTYNDIEDLKLN